MRGLKHECMRSLHSHPGSHPTWVRGLKLSCLIISVMVTFVAPYVGAWIETLSLMVIHDEYGVAPYVGAWIETLPVKALVYRMMSHPTWVRGLKLLVQNNHV